MPPTKRVLRSGFDRIPYMQWCEVDCEGEVSRALICNLSMLGAYLHHEAPPAVAVSEELLTYQP